MRYIKGQNRDQISIFPISLDDSIDQDNEVRVIDLFVESLDIGKHGFRIDHIENGRPAYHPKDLLKLYIYGYMNRVRSSRELEKECKRKNSCAEINRCNLSIFCGESFVCGE